MAVATRMPVQEVAFSLALSCALDGGQAIRSVRGHLDPTPRECFDEAARWCRSNQKVVELVRSDPTAVAAGSFSLSPARNWFGRLLGKKRVQAPADDELERVARDLAKRSPKAKARRADLEELQRLVDESL
ncbi:MAG: hypothetical protein AAGA56_08970 [Myxococcota bacterium]